MTVAIDIEMIAGRYHATPWDAHVNEGRVEWPPSPWRLLRALLAVGFTKLDWPGDRVPGDAIELIEALASSMPWYRLPLSVETHTRHYMPIRDGKNEKTTKVIDAYLRLGETKRERTLQVVWPDLELAESQLDLFRRLLGGLSYLGRAESWAAAELLDAGTVSVSTMHPDQWAVPVETLSNGAESFVDRVRLLTGEANFTAWREQTLERVKDQAELDVHRKAQAKGQAAKPAAIKKAHKKADDDLPSDLLASLMLDNADWQKQGWERPPGSRWLDYRLPRSATRRPAINKASLASTAVVAQVALLALGGSGKRGAVLPDRSRGLPLADLLHRRAVDICTPKYDEEGKLLPGTIWSRTNGMPVFTGSDEEGKPLRGPHPHTHWLPLCLDGKRHIDHVLAYAPGLDGRGWLDAAALAVLGQIRKAFSKGINDLAVTLVGHGSVEEIFSSLNQRGLKMPELATGRVWRSVTPFVPRLWVGRGRKRIENQINDELQERGLPEAQVCVLPIHKHLHLTKHVIQRASASSKQIPTNRRHAIELRFADPLRGPLALGRYSHFGLGMFAAVE